MSEWIIKIVMYSIIFTLSRVVTKKISQKNTVQRGDAGEYITEEKTAAKFFLVLAIVWTILGVIMINITSSKNEALAIAIFVVFAGSNYALSYIFGMYYMCIGNEKLIYRSPLGKVREYAYADFTRAVVDKNEKLRVYQGKKLAFTMGASPEQGYLIGKIKHYGVPIFYEQTVDYFLLEQTGVNKIGIIVCEIISLALLIFMVAIRYMLGIVVLFILTLGCLIGHLQIWKDKVVVTNATISQYGFCKKVKVLHFSEVKYLELKKKDEFEYIWIYSERGPEMKISKLYRHIGLFEELIKKKHWKWKKVAS